MTNTNCLEGFECPKCGYEDRFTIVSDALMEVTDNGTEHIGDTEWHDESYCRCYGCGHMGTVADFTGGGATPTSRPPASGAMVDDREVTARQLQTLKNIAATRLSVWKRTAAERGIP